MRQRKFGKTSGPRVAGSKAGIACMVIFLASASVQAAAGVPNGPIVGTWTTLSQSQITIEPCATGYCGFITKVIIPQHIRDKYGDKVDEFGGNYVDSLNKDPSLRERPVLGLQILALESEFLRGRMNGIIYNPEDGETYEGFLEMVDANNIRLSGCVLFNLICMGEDWVRTPAHLVARE